MRDRDKVKKNLDSLKDDLQVLKPNDMDNVQGGRKAIPNISHNIGCNGIVPQ